MTLSFPLPSAHRSAPVRCVALVMVLGGFLAALSPDPSQAAEPAAALPHWMGLEGAAADGSLLPPPGALTESDIEPFGSSKAGSESAAPPPTFGFQRSFNIPIGNFQFLLYAMPATGTVVGVQFSGSMSTNGDDMDAADARFELVDLVRGISWTVTGADLGWSGTGAFGPSETEVTHLFDGPLELDSDNFYLWESLNRSPGVGCIGCSASYDGDFIVTVQYPSAVALRASFAVDQPDSSGWAPRDLEYSFVHNPAFTVDYVYDESFGHWEEQPFFRCYDGDVNPTNFYLGIFNLTGKPVQACTFQASWDAQQHECSQAVLDVLNHPTNDRSVLIRTEDYIYVSDPECTQFTPTTEHVLPGVLHWMWVDFIIDGISYQRRMYFVRE